MGCLFSKKNNIDNIEFIEQITTKQLNEEQKEELNNIENYKKNLQYENLVLEGGGIKGIAYCGAFQVLEDLNILQNIKRVAGSSAGAILGTLIAIGYTSAEIKDIMVNFDFEALIDDKIGIIRDGINLIKDYGYTEGDYFLNEMGKLIEKKTNDSNYTFKQLFDQHGRTLVLVGCDLKKQNAVYFSHLYSPDLSIKQAVRISMSYPFVFEPVRYRDTLFIDGGFADIYPLHVFDGEYPGDPNAIKNLLTPNPKTLGLKLLTDNITINKNTNELNIDTKIDNIIDFTTSIIDSFFSMSERKHMTDKYWARTISIKIPNISSLDFSISDEIKQNLVVCGEISVKKFLKIEI